jgi:hypothetical protein
MRMIRSTGAFAERPHFDLFEIEKICSLALREAGLLPAEPSPVRIERFIEKRFGVSVGYERLPDGVLGYTLFGRSGVEAIIVSADFAELDVTRPTERRLRTTLAHEAGHGLMHAYLFADGVRPSGLFDEPTSRPEMLCRDVAGIGSTQTLGVGDDGNSKRIRQ